MQPQKKTELIQIIARIIVQYGFSLAAIIGLVSVLPELELREHAGILFVYTLLTILGTFTPVRSYNYVFTLNNTVVLSGLLLYGIWAATWIVVIEILILAFLYKMPLKRVLPNLGQTLITIWAVSYFYYLFSLLSLPWMISDLVLIFIYFLVNMLLVSLAIFAVYKNPWLTTVSNIIQSYSMTYLMIMVVGVLGTRLVAVYGWLAFLPSLIAFIFISIVFHNYVDGLHKIEQKMGEVKSLNDSFLTAMAAAIDARDPYTHGHSRRVAFWGRELAQALGLPKKQVDKVFFGGILHDVGKIGIEDAILNKEGKLTAEEFDRIKQHSVIGYEIVKQAGVFPELLPAIRSHHERIDGKGYPDGLKGDEIPQIARILAISDAFDAMVSDRPYRRGLTIEAALQQIRDGAGSQFDPVFAHTFIDVINRSSKEELVFLTQSNGPKKN